MSAPAPKPVNFDALAAAWNDPITFARESAIYDAQLAAARVARLEHADVTEPRRTPVDSPCVDGHRWLAGPHSSKRSCARCTASWWPNQPEPRPALGGAL